MSSKSLTNLNLPKNLLEKLHQNSIFGIQDLISKAPMELIKILNLPLSKINSIFRICFENLQAEPMSVLDLAQKQNRTNNEHDLFDKIIFENEILKKGILCEVCGPPGVGKTQFLFQLCWTNLLNLPDSSVIYIDTENNFSPDRLIELARGKLSSKCKNDEDLMNMTKNIYVYQKFTTADFEELMKFLEIEIILKKTSLIIIDSLASIVRREFSGSDSSVLYERSIFLSKTSARLKTIAEFLDVAVVTSNQIITVTNKSIGETEDSTVIPAMGSSWTHYVNIRIVLQYFDDEKREMMIAKSPVTPFRKYIYTINTTDGIVIEDFDQLVDGLNPSSIKMRTKPYSVKVN